MSSASLRERIPAPAAIAILAIAFTVGACSKGEPEGSKARPNAPVQMPKPAQQAPVAVESSEGLRERLARQEAASKMFEKPEPAKPAKSEPEKAPAAKAQAPAKASPPVTAPTPPAPVKTEPARADPPKAEPPKVDPPKVDPLKAEPPKVEAKVPPPAAARLVTRVDPEFPREATQAGAEHGSVKARLTIDAAGNVTQVEVVEAIPRRIFDRAVVRALSQWKYTEGPAARHVDVEVDFKR
jgi:TonB family protein